MRTPTSALLQPQAPNSIPKRQLLKELNTETRDVRTAINQPSPPSRMHCAWLGTDYQRRRMSIINTPDEELYA
jgi:hypothetical protein